MDRQVDDIDVNVIIDIISQDKEMDEWIDKYKDKLNTLVKLKYQ